MENFDHKIYRDGLASDLKELPKTDREDWLDSEKNTKEYKEANDLHKIDRVVLQKEVRIENLEEKIKDIQTELKRLEKERDNLVLVGSSSGLDAKIIEMPTGYLDNFERVELWEEFRQNAEKVIVSHIDNIQELADQGKEVRYNVGEASGEMFIEMQNTFNIPKDIKFAMLPIEIREKFIRSRMDLESKNGVGNAGKTPPQINKRFSQSD